MQILNPTNPYDGWITHVTGSVGAGKTSLIGDMLYTEMSHGPCAYLFTRREGYLDKEGKGSGGWTVLPPSVIEQVPIIFLETLADLDNLLKEWKKERRQALGIDTSTGLELLIKTKITGGESIELVSRTGKFQHKEFKSKLCYYMQTLRQVAKYTMLVSPAAPTNYNPEKGEGDVGISGSSIDADRRFTPDGENSDSKLKLLYLSDYCYHIRQEDSDSGRITKRFLEQQPSLKYMTKSRIKLGTTLENIKLEPVVGANWPLLRDQITHNLKGESHV